MGDGSERACRATEKGHTKTRTPSGKQYDNCERHVEKKVQTLTTKSRSEPGKMPSLLDASEGQMGGSGE